MLSIASWSKCATDFESRDRSLRWAIALSGLLQLIVFAVTLVVVGSVPRDEVPLVEMFPPTNSYLSRTSSFWDIFMKRPVKLPGWSSQSP